jgi:hypothetical protein
MALSAPRSLGFLPDFSCPVAYWRLFQKTPLRGGKKKCENEKEVNLVKEVHKESRETPGDIATTRVLGGLVRLS